MSTKMQYRHCKCGRFMMITADNYKFKSTDGVIHALADCTQPDTVTITVEEYERMTGLIREIAGITCYDTSAHGVACCLMRFEDSKDWCIPCKCKKSLGEDGVEDDENVAPEAEFAESGNSPKQATKEDALREDLRVRNPEMFARLFPDDQRAWEDG